MKKANPGEAFVSPGSFLQGLGRWAASDPHLCRIFEKRGPFGFQPFDLFLDLFGCLGLHPILDQNDIGMALLLHWHGDVWFIEYHLGQAGAG